MLNTSPSDPAIIIGRVIVVVVVLTGLVLQHHSMSDAVLRQLGNQQAMNDWIIIPSLVVFLLIGHLGIRHVIDRLGNPLFLNNDSPAKKDLKNDPNVPPPDPPPG